MNFRRLLTAAVFTAALLVIMVPAAVFADDHAGTFEDPIPMEAGQIYDVDITKPGQEVYFIFMVTEDYAGIPLYLVATDSSSKYAVIQGEVFLYNDPIAACTGYPDLVVQWSGEKDNLYLLKVRYGSDAVETGSFKVQLRNQQPYPDEMSYVLKGHKLKSYCDHFKMTGARDDLWYGFVIDQSETDPASTSDATFFLPTEGFIEFGYGEVAPNKTYFVHVFITESPTNSGTSPWVTFKMKSAKVPKPTNVKAVAGKKSMLVKWKTTGDPGWKYKVTYSAKGVKAKTITMKGSRYKNLSVRIRKLKKGKKYTVKIQAITGLGYKSAWTKKVRSGKIK